MSADRPEALTRPCDWYRPLQVWSFCSPPILEIRWQNPKYRTAVHCIGPAAIYYLRLVWLMTLLRKYRNAHFRDTKCLIFTHSFSCNARKQPQQADVRIHVGVNCEFFTVV